jgi:dTDP-4-amino-4,6-dideoxygalactose transaminase
MPGPGLQLLGPEERAEVLEVLDSRELSRYRFGDDSLASPSKTFLFEQELSEFTGARYCLGTNSCTSALLAGIWAAGIGAGDEVIVPGYTFVASIAAIAYAGATPVLAEIDDSLTIDPNDVRRKITPRTKAILAVHMLGAPCNMEALRLITKEYGTMLIEDCAQAGGGQFQGRALGTFGSFGAFSLNVFKTFTAGDGGVLLTNDRHLYERAFAVHDHGARPHRAGVADADSILGLNFRMHELTGAVARAQLKKLPSILSRLRDNKTRLRDAIGSLPYCQERRIHDAAGECATVLAYSFTSAQQAKMLADSLGTITLSQSGKHNYANIPQLAHRALPVGSFRGSFKAGVLPQTDALLARTVALSVGVVDSYLGTGFGVDIHSNDTEIQRVARLFRLSVLRTAQAKSA